MLFHWVMLATCLELEMIVTYWNADLGLREIHWVMLTRCLELEMIVTYWNADLGLRERNTHPTNVVHKCSR
jgi:hypothetical protein